MDEVAGGAFSAMAKEERQVELERVCLIDRMILSKDFHFTRKKENVGPQAQQRTFERITEKVPANQGQE